MQLMKMRWFVGVGGVILLACAASVAQERPEGSNASAPPAAAAVGKPAPAFELKDSTGKSFKLSDYKDKVVLLEWYNQQCPVCVRAMPMMAEAHKTYTGKGVVWLAIDSTHGRKAEDVEKWRSEKGVHYPILLDADGTVGRAYGARTTPHIFVIDKGTLVYAGAHKEEKGERNYIAETLDAVLAGSPVPVAETKSWGCTVKYKSGK